MRNGKIVSYIPRSGVRHMPYIHTYVQIAPIMHMSLYVNNFVCTYIRTYVATFQVAGLVALSYVEYCYCFDSVDCICFVHM